MESRRYLGQRAEPHTQRIYDMLSRGPQPYQKVLAAAAALVPPGKAWRAAEKNRLRQSRRNRGGDEPTKERVYNKDEDKIIRSGQRQIAQHTLLQFIRFGRIDRFNHKGEDYIRLPENLQTLDQSGIRCLDCGDELYSNSQFDVVSCQCNPPKQVTGGVYATTFTVPDEAVDHVQSIRRKVFMLRLPRFYRSEFSPGGTRHKMRRWIVEETR